MIISIIDRKICSVNKILQFSKNLLNLHALINDSMADKNKFQNCFISDFFCP